jgi:hypothetical protein
MGTVQVVIQLVAMRLAGFALSHGICDRECQRQRSMRGSPLCQAPLADLGLDAQSMCFSAGNPYLSPLKPTSISCFSQSVGVNGWPRQAGRGLRVQSVIHPNQ